MDGEFDGTVRSIGAITIGQNGIAIGDFHAGTVIISGQLSGTLTAETVEILSSGSVTAKVVAKDFTIEKGGVFEGEALIKSDDVSLSAEFSKLKDNSVVEEKKLKVI